MLDTRSYLFGAFIGALITFFGLLAVAQLFPWRFGGQVKVATDAKKEAICITVCGVGVLLSAENARWLGRAILDIVEPKRNVISTDNEV